MPPDVLHADQAAGLRRVFQRARLAILPVCAPGRDGASQAWVVRTAAALAERGRRVVLLDAGREFIASSLGLKARLELRHLLAGDCRFDEALLPVAANFDLLPASRGLDLFLQSGEKPPALFDAFLALDPPASVLLVNGPVSTVAALVPPGREVLFVASPERESITGVYAAIKELEQALPGRTARIAVTGVADTGQGTALATRLADAAERFLGHTPEFAEFVCDGSGLQQAARSVRIPLGAGPDDRIADDFLRIADGFDRWQVTYHSSSLQG